MPNYRLYGLDGEGRIGLADWIEADDDDQAIAEAGKMRPKANRCEVWLNNRLVAKLNGFGELERVDRP